MKIFILGMVLGSVLTGLTGWAQNQDFYGRPQWGKQISPPYDAYGRPNPPPAPYQQLQQQKEPC